MAKKPSYIFHAVFFIPNGRAKPFIAKDTRGRLQIFDLVGDARRRAIWLEDRREATQIGRYEVGEVMIEDLGRTTSGRTS